MLQIQVYLDFQVFCVFMSLKFKTVSLKTAIPLNTSLVITFNNLQYKAVQNEMKHRQQKTQHIISYLFLL